MHVQKEAFYPFFPAADSVLLFNMQIDFGKNHFSGILLVKSTGKDRYRTVFTSHFGMSVFDFEVDSDSFRVNYCLEALHKKRFLQILEADFSALLFLNPETDGSLSDIYVNDAASGLEVIKAGKYYYLKNKVSETLIAIEAPQPVNARRYRFSDYKDKFPALIQIQHSHIGLKMQLERINRE
jgi:hypothetical protein